MVVENAWQLGEWEKARNTADGDPVGLLDDSFKALAYPI
jgi:hypothetical protein